MVPGSTPHKAEMPCWAVPVKAWEGLGRFFMDAKERPLRVICFFATYLFCWLIEFWKDNSLTVMCVFWYNQEKLRSSEVKTSYFGGTSQTRLVMRVRWTMFFLNVKRLVLFGVFSIQVTFAEGPFCLFWGYKICVLADHKITKEAALGRWCFHWHRKFVNVPGI